ncbi:MAG: preprotein translocase subunit YajC [Clostridia bacterium]|nr:preprotein translocase subunit YajC [Clostridia bacterium]
MDSFMLLILFFALLYFLMIRPQQKQQKKRREMLDNLRKGDDIVTIGGIYGVIKALRDDKVVIEIAKGVNVTVLKNAIGQVLTEHDDEDEIENEENTEMDIENK